MGKEVKIEIKQELKDNYEDDPVVQAFLKKLEETGPRKE